MLVMTILRKGVSSLQNTLNTLFHDHTLSLVTNSALSKARQNLRHSAFVALNQSVTDTFYEEPCKRFHGLRMLAVDGSKVILPQNDATIAVFGSTEIHNQRAPYMGSYTFSLASVLYDVLNGIALDATLNHGDSYEVDVASGHLTHIRRDDLVVFDRGYCSFRMMHLMAQTKGDFLIRCSRASFKEAKLLFADMSQSDLIVTIAPNQKYRGHYGYEGTLPLTVRFVKVILDTGEAEVLVTSLLDTEKYPTTLFKELYWMRWGIEGLYSILKTRLELENFGGKSVESIRQEFHAAIFLTTLESVLTHEENTELTKKETTHEQRINTAQAFHSIKEKVFDLLVSDTPIDAVLDELSAVFLKRPTIHVVEKNPPRKTSSSTCLLNFARRVKKRVF
jgi:hypothetical protein